MTSVSAAANAVKLPLIVGEAGMVVNGALATYGIDYYRLGKQTAEMAVKLLKADKPLDEIAKWQSYIRLTAFMPSTRTPLRLSA